MMMEVFAYLLVGVGLGAVAGYLWSSSKYQRQIQQVELDAQRSIAQSEREYTSFKATSAQQLIGANKYLQEKTQELYLQKEANDRLMVELSQAREKMTQAQANLQSLRSAYTERSEELVALKGEWNSLQSDLNAAYQQLAIAQSQQGALEEKLQTQKEEMERMGQKFNLEFEHIANNLLETKAAKFTELNRNQMASILEPLGQNIQEFKARVNEVYDKESKERFSLGERVKELAALNQLIGEEARNLTNALKGEAKTQGRWGEMILENILEKSGLVKGREYFMEHELYDRDGKPLRSDMELKKMRPDAVIKYPDNRSVIIDSKVSLNAFLRFLNATDKQIQQQELQAHIAAVKSHIVALSNKGYDDYDKALDFVMLFIPSEPAYMAALQGDADLWNYAYDRRILLLSPTNLITSLKLIVDLWKREYQNQNAQEIAERGAKLYDKFSAFVQNMQDIGLQINKAQTKYQDAFKQLTTGNDNLVLQATKLKNLGLKTKKVLPEHLQAVSGNEEG
ncbi:DNA recombination protein RmuC [Dyadobacter jejuensis]|uniref:DNA recombination protein RmuC n=1 Tax=Dyadobacter jejuensis TaxID=1082580 RepID=A0A316AQ61_9BACT|nr:DNA recombination protein RmuC [Dyadobacter jejuensis]PWJ59873.1 DNA recombination protein RmuC [Dyadobacter jejuensis]